MTGLINVFDRDAFDAVLPAKARTPEGRMLFLVMYIHGAVKTWGDDEHMLMITMMHVAIQQFVLHMTTENVIAALEDYIGMVKRGEFAPTPMDLAEMPSMEAH